MRVAEFFAGIGLMRAGLEQVGGAVVWANDIDPKKQALYAANFASEDFRLADIREVRGADLPGIEVATASFPCQDLSLAGERAGLAGAESGLFYEFTRILAEMKTKRPRAVLVENVLGFASSRGGRDLAAAIGRLNTLGYSCDILAVDARHFVPQSRPRLFIVGDRRPATTPRPEGASDLRPAWIARFAKDNPKLRLHASPLPALPVSGQPLAASVERMRREDERWWPAERLDRFLGSLSEQQRARLDSLCAGSRLRWRSAFRRTRAAGCVWEIRADEIAGCLRTVRGGSSRQAVVECGQGEVRARWMTPREYARLQGAPDFRFKGLPDAQVMFGFGDAVCVPAVAWVGREYLARLFTNLRGCNDDDGRDGAGSAG